MGAGVWCGDSGSVGALELAVGQAWSFARARESSQLPRQPAPPSLNERDLVRPTRRDGFTYREGSGSGGRGS